MAMMAFTIRMTGPLSSVPMETAMCSPVLQEAATLASTTTTTEVTTPTGISVMSTLLIMAMLLLKAMETAEGMVVTMPMVALILMMVTEEDMPMVIGLALGLVDGRLQKQSLTN